MVPQHEEGRRTEDVLTTSFTPLRVGRSCLGAAGVPAGLQQSRAAQGAAPGQQRPGGGCLTKQELGYVRIWQHLEGIWLVLMAS